MSPSDNSKLTNGVSFNNIGLSSIKDSTAFKKIQYFSKISTGDINSSTLNFSNKFNNVNNLYLNSYKFNDAYSYGTFRQHNYTSLGANLSSNGSLLDLKGSDKFIQFNLNSNPNSNTQNVLTPLIKSSTHNNVNSSSHFKSTLINTSKNLFLNSFYKNNKISNSVLFYPNYKDHVSNSYLNFLKYILNSAGDQDNSNLINTPLFTNFFYTSDLQNKILNNESILNFFNNKLSYKFKNLKSSNMQFFTTERNIRVLENLTPNLHNANFSLYNNNFTDIYAKVAENKVCSNISNLYFLDKLN